MDRLGKSLRLTDDEEAGLVLTAGEWRGSGEHEPLLLVGRLLTPRSYRYDALKATLLSILRPARGMEHEVDQNRVLGGWLWVVDGNAVILGKVRPEMNPLEVDLNWCPFYIHIHGLLLRMMTKEVAESVGRRIGTFLESDHAQASAQWGVKQSILGHIMRDCFSLDTDIPIGPETELPYGPSLRESRAGRQLMYSGGLAREPAHQGRSWGNGVSRGGGLGGRRGIGIFEYGPEQAARAEVDSSEGGSAT
ncbi:hypothetical protein Salat_0159100 [Sesamum alatum]|uniref:DUF4283 domain-containing protein n=1 Tax=Sesamum alatum TaxID=300844 RepID=A0AAE1YXS5_9LAMI|nr:hypothetical protein Salat_0159100 [Sesamum alatum]